MIAAGIEELNQPQQFRKIYVPVLFIIIAAVWGAGFIARSRRITVFRSGLTMEPAGIEELNDPQQFR